jgi:dienelactone hydrolase
MRRRVRAGLVAACLVVGAVTAAPADAQTPAAVQVGIPGCSDDVAVRASREAITFLSRGRTVRAWLYSPGGEPNGDGLVMLHGGTGFEMNAILFDAHAIQLASRGYSVILPAYFDASAPDQRRRLVNGRAWRQVALDAAAVLTDRAGTNPGRVALWGYSRGAGVAVNAATMADSGVRSAILVAGGGSIGEDPATADLSVLLLHARRDEAVPVRATLDLADALREAGAEVQVQGLDFDGHQYDLPTWCAVMGRTRSYLEPRTHD